MFPLPLADRLFDSTSKGINLVNHIPKFHNLLDASIWLTCAGSVLSLPPQHSSPSFFFLFGLLEIQFSCNVFVCMLIFMM